MKYKKIGCLADNTELAQNLLLKLIKKDAFFNLHDTKVKIKNLDAIIVMGGDGFMLHKLHDYISTNLPFYGINCGSVGFLLNPYIDEKILKHINEAQQTIIYPLNMKATTQDGSCIESFAINEVSLFRQTYQAAKIKISIDGKSYLEELFSDGVLVSTAAGSTAYNYSAGGPILPINANLLSLRALSPFRPRRWQGALIHKASEIEFEIINSFKRPVSSTADFLETRNVEKIVIKENKNKKIRLLFDIDNPLEARNIKEQFAI